MPRRTLQEALASHLADAAIIRGAEPPIPVEPGGIHPPPRPLSEGEMREEAQSFLGGVAEGFGLVGRGVMRPLTFATEQLSRADTLFRGTILTAFGKIPLDEYPQFWRDATSGRRKISGDAFMEMAFGESLWKQLENINIIPWWTRDVVSPLPKLGGIDLRRDPVVSLGRVLGFGADLFVSPFAALSATPRGFFTATKLGRLAAKAQLDPATSLLTFPLRRFARMAVSPQTPWGALLLQLRDPPDALGKFPRVVDSMLDGALRMEDAGDHWGRTLVGLAKRHVARKGVLGVGARPGLSRDELAGVLDHVFMAPQELNERQTALVSDFMEQVIRPTHKRLAEMGYDKTRAMIYEDVRKMAEAEPRRAGYTGAARLRAPEMRERLLTWDPEKDLLRKFNPTPFNYRVPPNPIGEKSIEERLSINMHWKRRGVELSFKPSELTADQKNPFHALEMWVSQAERKMILAERIRDEKGILRDTGLLNKFLPRGLNGHPTVSSGVNVNPEALAGASDAEWRYFINKLHDFTGNRAGKLELTINNTMDRFFTWIDKLIESPARKSRIYKYFYEKSRQLDPRGFPASNTWSAIASSLTGGTIIATLGLNLSSAIKNTSQLLNVAAKEGVPATIRGLYRMADFWSDEGKTLRELRKAANFRSEFRKVLYDDVWVRAGKRGVDGFLMWPFSTTEMWMRGIQFNVSVGERLRVAGVHTLDHLIERELKEPRFLSSLVRTGRREALDTNFVYGIAGRSHLMMHPVARVGFALQSYSWKEAEFIARTWARDGGAFMRLVGLHGWVIDMADQMAGVNAESWLGWGFLPPNTFGGRGPSGGPALEALTNLVHATYAAADGAEGEFGKRTNALRGNIREIFRFFGDPEDTPGLQAALAASAMSGLLPVPVVGVARSFKALNEFMTGVRQTQGGRTWQRVTKKEALASWFFMTHRQAEDSRLKAMEISVRRQVDGELDRRTKKFLRALKGRDGDEVSAAAKELASPIGLSLPVSGQGFVRGIPSGFRLGDERSFWPHPEMIESRMSLRGRQMAVSRDVNEMIDSGWVGEILWAEYANRGFSELARGAINLREKQ